MIVIPVCQIRCCFIFIHTVSAAEQDFMWGLAWDQTSCVNNRVFCSYYRKATVASAGQQSKVCRGDSAVSIQTLLSCSMSEDFIDYSVKLSVATSKRKTQKTSIRCVFFIFFNGRKTGCGFCKFLCSDTLLIFIGPSLKVSLMVHLCFCLASLEASKQRGSEQ